MNVVNVVENFGKTDSPNSERSILWAIDADLKSHVYIHVIIIWLEG